MSRCWKSCESMMMTGEVKGMEVFESLWQVKLQNELQIVRGVPDDLTTAT